MLHGAIDLHSNSSVVGIVNQAGDRIYKRKLPNDLETIKKDLAQFGPALRDIAVESTFNWYWLVDGLKEAGYCTHLVNTTACQQYSGLKHVDDETDAFWVADQMRLGILREGYIYPREQRAVRDLLRKRGQLVQLRTRIILSIENLTSRNRGVHINSNQVKKMTPKMVEETYDNPDLALAITSSLQVLSALEEQIAVIEKHVKNKVKLSEPYQMLQTVSGIGETLAMTIMLEAGDMKRFPSVGDFSSYCRCVDSRWTSNDKKKGSGNTKNGNKYLGWAFVEAANFAIRYQPVIGRYYQRKAARTKPVVARKAVAHKLARASYYVMRDRVPFDVTKCFGPTADVDGTVNQRRRWVNNPPA